jgi:ABC-type dipeptide/oligopeptide/nickel transport system permease subunit
LASTGEYEATWDALPALQPEWKRLVRVFLRRKLAVTGLVLVVLMVLMAIFAPLIAPYDPYATDLDNKLQHPSSEHWLGTDSVGRDTLSRCIYGARTSLVVGLSAVFLGAIVGQLLGLIAGFFGGWVFTVIMRLIDAMMAIPMIVLALVIASVLGGGVKNVIIALAIGSIPGQCRMMCAQTLSVKENDYILAGRTIGIGSTRTMFRHIFPNAFAPCLVLMTIGMGATILAEAGLSFLGAGINPPTAAWGYMIKEGYGFLLSNPELSIAPGFFIMLVVFGFNMMGDGLRDALDPRLRGTV